VYLARDCGIKPPEKMKKKPSAPDEEATKRSSPEITVAQPSDKPVAEDLAVRPETSSQPDPTA